MRRLWLIFSQAVTVTLGVVFLLSVLESGGRGWAWWDRLRASITTSDPGGAAGAEVVAAPSRPGQSAGSLATAARRASPSVVSVMAQSARRGSSARADGVRRHYDADEPASGMGSAVIVTRDGYLLTNFHVVDKAEDIEVALLDGRRLRADVVGTDPDSDLAVLKLEVRDLPAIAFGNADAMQVGDAVLAIGNPFNVGQTVTSGIVSALGRSGLGLNTFENFIQTDAAINPGNSGGALVDDQGRLLGINTAIYSRSGGSNGIGFAIPVSTARQVLDALVRDGVVTRGWIGVQPVDLTPDSARSLQLSVEHGVLISGVLQDGPARRAGMLPGDVVLRIGEITVASTSQLLNVVAALKPASQVVLTVQRGERSMRLPVTIGQRPSPRALAGQADPTMPR